MRSETFENRRKLSNVFAGQRSDGVHERTAYLKADLRQGRLLADSAGGRAHMLVTLEPCSGQSSLSVDARPPFPDHSPGSFGVETAGLQATPTPRGVGSTSRLQRRAAVASRQVRLAAAAA